MRSTGGFDAGPREHVSWICRLTPHLAVKDQHLLVLQGERKSEPLFPPLSCRYERSGRGESDRIATMNQTRTVSPAPAAIAPTS